MKKTLTKDLILSSGRIIEKGKQITTENEPNILRVDKAKFEQLEKEGYFKTKRIINQ